MRFSAFCCALFLILPLPACRSNKTKSGLASGPAAYAPQNGLVFTGRRPDGREIALSNRTKWSIQPAGASATLHWQPGEVVRLSQSGEPLWPIAITNQTAGSTAFARPAGNF